MIALNYQNINQNFKQMYQIYQNDIKKVEDNIENIRYFSEFLEVISINKLKVKEQKSDILLYIKIYELLLTINNYDSFKCPLCKKSNTFHYHKTYQRNIVFHYDDYEIVAKIELIVLECLYCKDYNRSIQHYHAIIPDFIFPYHIFSRDIIINCLIKRYIDKMLIRMVIEQANITHQLYYKWLKEFNKYLLVSSIILQTKNQIIDVLQEMKERLDKLQFGFYQNYNHPYFLFKLTCVDLAIML